METLVKAGAKVNLRRMKDGWTPLFLATIFGHNYKAKYFLKIQKFKVLQEFCELGI